MRPALVAALLAAALATQVSAAPGAAAPTRFPVIGYYPSWTGVDPNPAQFPKLTHVIYAFVLPTAAGGLGDVNGKVLGELGALGRKHGVKVLVAVGGWNNGNTTEFESLARRPKTRQRFITALLELCDLNRLDGVDIDWEYPKAASAADYALLMRELGDALHKTGRILTTAVVAMGDEYGVHVHPEVFAAIDYLNIMAYDWNWGQTGVSHSSFGVADSSLDYWLKKGCPKGKAVLGLPFYGRQPETPYRELAGRDKDAPNRDQAGAIFYNGIPTIRKKVELARSKAGGVMIWELSQDTQDSTSLLSAIHAALATDPALAK